MYMPYPGGSSAMGASPGSNAWIPGSSPGSTPGSSPGSKLTAYMNRVAPGGSYHNVAAKMANLALDPTISNMQKPLGGGGGMQNMQQFSNKQQGMSFPGGHGGFPRFANVTANPPVTTSGMYRGAAPPSSGAMFSGASQLNSSNFTRQSNVNAPQVDPAKASGGEEDGGPGVSVFSENGTTYFYKADEPLPEQLATGAITGGSILLPNWSAYSGTPSQVVNIKVRTSAPAAVRDNEIKMEILTRQQLCHAAADPTFHRDLPAEVDNFTNLCPLEPPSMSPIHKSSTFSYVTTVYKSINVKTGQHMCLRRIHSYRLVNTKCMSSVDQWKKMAHSNIVGLRQVFTSKSFGDHSMVFVYDYYPGAVTLMSKHFTTPAPSGMGFPGEDFGGNRPGPYSQQKSSLLRQQSSLLPEAAIWNYIIQLTSALRCIHGAGLACRTLDPTKILVINKTNRILINCVGIFDVLTFDPSNPVSNMPVYQQEDLVSLGRITLALACNSFMAIQRENLQSSMEVVTSTYSSDLRNMIMYLLTNPQRVKSVNDLMPMIGARFYTAVDSLQQHTDVLEVALHRDVESSRLFTLLCKLSTVVDRAEFRMDSSWAETGDRYMVKLFRDYMFHQVMEDGRPFLDMSHIIANLNRLDAGIPDKICLMSRDEQNVLLVSYAEIKNCLEQSYKDIVADAGSKPRIQPQH